MASIALPLLCIIPDSAQPRRSMSEPEFETLVDSIRQKGQLLPLRVKPADASGRHVLISGHRRFAALRQLGAKTAERIVVGRPLDDATVLAEQLAENIHRENLSPIEEADAYRRYIALKDTTAAQAAAELHVLPARISRALALLSLPEPIRVAIQAGRIPKETAYYLSRLPDGCDREQFFTQALAGTLSRDAAVRAVKTQAAHGPSAAPTASRVNCKLPMGRSVTVSGAAIDVDTLIGILEEVLQHARKARVQNWDVSTLAKVLKDRAAVGGTA